MAGLDETKGGAPRDGAVREGAGEVEEAGETTAADTVSGPTDLRPVGDGTMVKVSGDTDQNS